MKNNNLLIIITLTTLSCNTISDKEKVKSEFEKLNIMLTDNFKILEFKYSGLTDYTLDFELLNDTVNFYRISEFITNQSGFFVGDTTDNVELFNNHSYIKNDQLFWEQYMPTENSYEYRRIKADNKTRIVKYHYLDE